MSLINDMLRDLSEKQSSRQDVEALAIDDGQQVSWEQEKIANFFNYSRLPLIVGSLILFFVLYFILQTAITKLSFTDFSFTDNNQRQVPVAQLIPVIENQHDIPFNQIEQKTEVGVNTFGVKSLNQNQVQIYQLIDQASRAMTLDRLTSPEHDNAYFYYQELLKLDPTNTVALSGLQKISDRYIQIASKAVERKQYRKAEAYIAKASLVTPDSSRIIELRSKILSDSSIAARDINQESVSVADPFDKNLSSPAGNYNRVNSTSTGMENHSQTEILQDDERSAPDASLTITHNSEFLDEKAVKQAGEFVRQRLKYKAIELLEQQIQVNSSPLSEEYLLDIYYQDKNITDMQRLLNTNLKMAQVDQTYFRARASLLQNDNHTAIGLLESQLSIAITHENYRALLAGLYQREQLYPQAITAYRNLLQSFEPKPAYWLGLALSLDAQEQSQAAVHAYTQLLSFVQIEPQVHDYAQKRISELTR